MYKIYVVEEGDTLISIAAKFNTTTEILNTINGKIPKIEKGTEIIVPNVTEIPFAIYKVKKGDSLYDIARRNDINYKDIILLNGLKTAIKSLSSSEFVSVKLVSLFKVFGNNPS